MTEQIEVTDDDRVAFYREIVPYGYMDIDAAIRAAKEASKDAKWAAEQVTRYADECDTKIEDIDPVGVVYESILQEARNEIDEQAGYDLCNDAKARTGIYTAGNYCCTNYDYSEDAIEELCEKLVEKEVEIDGLTESTQWFLKEIGIDNERLEKYQ